jgi:hypothetical protein
MFALGLGRELTASLFLALSRQRHPVVNFFVEDQEQHSQRADDCLPKIFLEKPAHHTLLRRYEIQSVSHLLKRTLGHDMILF